MSRKLNRKIITRPSETKTGFKAIYYENIGGNEEVQIINYDRSRNLSKAHIEINELDELIKFLKEIKEEEVDA